MPKKIDLSDCVDVSLQEKLNAFEQELYDSLSPQKITFDRLVLKAIEKEKIQLDYIEFTDSEVKSLKLCVSEIKNNKLTDTAIISKDNSSIYSDFKYEIKNALLDNIHTMDKNVILFWLYKYLDKTYINVFIEAKMENGKEVISVNGEKATNYEINEPKSLRNLIRKHYYNGDVNKKEFGVISIRADADSVNMNTIDKIELELREINALRIQYTTL